MRLTPISIHHNRAMALLTAFAPLFCLSFSAQAQEKIIPPKQEVVTQGGVGAPPSDCTAYPFNIVANCGFENPPDFSSWTYTGDPTYVGVSTTPPPVGAPHSGSYAAFFGPVGALGCISQVVVTPAFFYNIFAYFANDSRPNEFQVWWDGVLISDRVDMADTLGYTLYHVENLATPGSTTELKFCFRNDPSYIGFDDVIVCDPDASGCFIIM